MTRLLISIFFVCVLLLRTIKARPARCLFQTLAVEQRGWGEGVEILPGWKGKGLAFHWGESGGSSFGRCCCLAGTTFVCQECASGHFQDSGASVSCNPCPAGSYQNKTGSISCSRCAAGEYQDQKGSIACKPCPAYARTALLGSDSISDCGCEDGFINTAENGDLHCVPCGEGLECPFASSTQTLQSGRFGQTVRLSRAE